ncbi:hypothetical protein PspLS_11204 [Pyricularia sp. CBS 133598]|nr:hypothetical protein PspLS_11204 [Pyricularia sp. CBS 133598]
MAAPTSDLPWDLLTSHFKFDTSHPVHGDVTDFYLRHEPDQGRDINKFVELLSESLTNSAAEERKKYAESYDAPDPNDIVIPESDLVRIDAALRRWLLSCNDFVIPPWFQNRGLPVESSFRQSAWRVRRLNNTRLPLSTSRTGGASICAHVGDYNCECLPRFEERRMSTFLHNYQWNSCFEFDEVNGDGFYGLELLKALMLHGSMDTVLRICAHSEIDVLGWWDVQTCQCSGDDVALGMMCRDALRVYILLNFIRRGFPERCARNTEDKAKSEEEERSNPSPDYLNTRTYQRLVNDVTKSDLWTEIPQFRHMEFFGIRNDHSRSWPRKGTWGKQSHDHIYPLGRLSYKEFLAVDTNMDPPYMPSAAEVETVMWLLRAKGLPTELVDMILGLAEYDEMRVLSIPHDPLHELNRDQLDEYLAWSWQTLLRFDMLARAQGDEIPWDMLISKCLLNSFPISIPWGFSRPGETTKETTKCYTQNATTENRGLRRSERDKIVFL